MKACFFPVAWPFPGLEFTKASFLSAAWSFPRLEFTRAFELPAAWPPFADGLTQDLAVLDMILVDLPCTGTCPGMPQLYTRNLYSFMRLLGFFDATSMKSAMGTSPHLSFSAEDASSANAAKR